jgi:hypothetical protein
MPWPGMHSVRAAGKRQEEEGGAVVCTPRMRGGARRHTHQPRAAGGWGQGSGDGSRQASPHWPVDTKR